MSHGIFLTKIISKYVRSSYFHAASVLQARLYTRRNIFVYKKTCKCKISRRRDLILPKRVEKYFSKNPSSLQLSRVKTPIRFDSIVPPPISLSLEIYSPPKKTLELSRERGTSRNQYRAAVYETASRGKQRDLSPLSLWVRLDRFESCSRTLKHTSAVDSGVIKSRASGPSLGSNFAAAECPTRWIVAPEVPALFPALEL